MRSEVSVLLTVGALLVLPLPFPAPSLAADARQIVGQEESRWVPSLAISGGALIQEQKGFANSVLFEDGSTTPVPLQGEVDGDDLVVSPFVGASLELMTPALPVPTRPRLFLSGEILPTFGSDRQIVVQEDPGCIRGPALDAPCARDLTGVPDVTFSEDSAQGEGTSLTTLFDTLTFGASLGVAFPAKLGKRQLRIKPSFGWIHYKVGAEGLVSNAKCALDPSTPQIPNDTACTPRTAPGGGVIPGFLRETTLEASGSQMFNALGGGLDIEVDTVRYGPVGASLFLGGGAYRNLGDRTIGLSTSQTFTDQLGNDVATADFEAEVDPWIYRAHVGIRFQWLGFPE